MKSDKEYKIALRGLDVELVESAESKIRIKDRGVAIMCCAVNCNTQVDGQLQVQVFHYPGPSEWLPECVRDADHFLTAPSSTQGGLKSLSLILGIKRKASVLLKCDSASTTELSTPGMWRTWASIL